MLERIKGKYKIISLEGTTLEKKCLELLQEANINLDCFSKSTKYSDIIDEIYNKSEEHEYLVIGEQLVEIVEKDVSEVEQSKDTKTLDGGIIEFDVIVDSRCCGLVDILQEEDF